MHLAPNVLTMAEFGHVLATRKHGRQAADRLQDAMTAHGVIISFNHVEVATPSFLDELLTRLQGLLLANEDALVVVASMNDDVVESLELVVSHRGMVLGALDNGQLRLLGGGQHLQETLMAAEQLGTFRATDLAEALELKLPNLHQRLATLREAGVVRRTPDSTATRGKRHNYAVLDRETIQAHS
jgi:DNA-binding HxlR family transcriptional regulator